MRWLWLLFVSVSLSAQSTYTILFDQTLGQPVYPFDNGPSGMTEFCYLFKAEHSKDKASYWIEPVARNLDSALADAQYKLLVLTPTIHRSYSPATVKSIHRFVKNGGALLVFTEHENYYNNSASLNEITNEFGITTLNNAYVTGHQLTDAWIRADCPSYKLKALDFYLPATLKLSKGAKAVANADTAIVVATATYGKGRVAVVSDYEMAWNFAINKNYDNVRLLYFLTEWLIGHEIKIDDLFTQQKHTIADKKNHSLTVYEGSDYFFDFVSGIIPAHANDTLKMNIITAGIPYFTGNTEDTTAKYILIADGCSNYMKMLIDNNAGLVVDAVGYKYDKRLLEASELSGFGMRFVQQTLVDSCLNGYTVTLQPTGQKASCITYIDTLESKRFTVVYSTNAAAVDYNAPLGIDGFEADKCIPVPSNLKHQQRIVALYSKQAFAIADMELFLHIKENPYLLKAFTDWLKLK